MMPRRLRAAALALSAGLSLAAAARADDPPLAPGHDPSGTPVAVLSAGFDTTRPELARLLARDGEGEAIAWDAADNDPRPFARDGDGTDIALAAAAHGGVRIVPVRIATDDPASLARGVAFAVQTPARIVLAAPSAGTQPARDVLAAAARKFEHALFVGSLRPDEKEGSESPPNLILLDGGQDGLGSAAAVARVLGCGRGDLGGATGADQKRVFLDRLEKAPAAGCPPERDAETEQR